MYKLQRAITLTLAALLIIFFAFWVQQAHASTNGNDSVAAWKYSYPSDDISRYAVRLGTINGVLLGLNEAFGIVGYSLDAEQRACINDNFWPTERSHVGGVIEAVYGFVDRTALDVGEMPFAGSLAALVVMRCVPELATAPGGGREGT